MRVRFRADAAKTAGWKKVVAIASDYVGGVETNGAFARVFCNAGGRIVQELWPPLGTADFAPFITQIDRGADAVVVFTPSADGLRSEEHTSELQSRVDNSYAVF